MDIVVIIVGSDILKRFLYIYIEFAYHSSAEYIFKDLRVFP